jgi:hypothetical protein
MGSAYFETGWFVENQKVMSQLVALMSRLADFVC